MGRRPKHSAESIAAAAMSLVAEGGPSAATIGAIAKAIGAPTGSIYYRFGSRKELLAQLWLTVVEGYQSGVLQLLADGDGPEAGIEAAVFMPRWVREHPVEARLLLLHHRRDFVRGDWPDPVVDRAQKVRSSLGSAIVNYTTSLYGAASNEHLARVRFATLSVPYGAVRPFVQEGRPPPPLLDDLIRTSATAVLQWSPT